MKPKVPEVPIISKVDGGDISFKEKKSSQSNDKPEDSSIKEEVLFKFNKLDLELPISKPQIKSKEKKTKPKSKENSKPNLKIQTMNKDAKIEIETPKKTVDNIVSIDQNIRSGFVFELKKPVNQKIEGPISFRQQRGIKTKDKNEQDEFVFPNNEQLNQGPSFSNFPRQEINPFESNQILPETIQEETAEVTSEKADNITKVTHQESGGESQPQVTSDEDDDFDYDAIGF